MSKYTLGSDLKKFEDALQDIADVQNELGGKVDKVSGKGLSAEDFSTAHRMKLEGIPASVAPLDGGGKVPAANLPSYVDDVLEFSNLASFPVTGETGKIYTALDTNKIYRWSGSVYIEIVASVGSTDSVAEGSVNLYFTNTRAQAAVQALLDGKASKTDVEAIQAWLNSPASSVTIPAADLNENQVILLIGSLNATNTKVNALVNAVSTLQARLVSKGILS